MGAGRRQTRRWGKGPWGSGEWEQKGARPGGMRRSPVGETALFAGENKGEGEMMLEAELPGQKLLVVVPPHSPPAPTEGKTKTHRGTD